MLKEIHFINIAYFIKDFSFYVLIENYFKILDFEKFIIYV